MTDILPFYLYLIEWWWSIKFFFLILHIYWFRQVFSVLGCLVFLNVHYIFQVFNFFLKNEMHEFLVFQEKTTQIINHQEVSVSILWNYFGSAIFKFYLAAQSFGRLDRKISGPFTISLGIGLKVTFMTYVQALLMLLVCTPKWKALL